MRCEAFTSIDTSKMTDQERVDSIFRNTDLTITLKGESLMIEGHVPTTAALAISGCMLELACEGEGDNAVYRLAMSWNELKPNHLPKLYTEKDVRDLKTTIETLKMALSAKEEGR